MSSYKYKHLTLDDRIMIQKALKEGKTFAEIGGLLGKDPSTISKEVKGILSGRTQALVPEDIILVNIEGNVPGQIYALNQIQGNNAHTCREDTIPIVRSAQTV